MRQPHSDEASEKKEDLMRALTRLRLIAAVALSFAISTCGVRGDVVRVTTIKNGQLDGLREGDLVRLKEAKKARDTQNIHSTVANMIEATPHFSVSEYLMQYPEAKGTYGVDYNVGGYDVLSIIVYEEKDLSRRAVRVSSDGYISFPLIGRLRTFLSVGQVAGAEAPKAVKEVKPAPAPTIRAVGEDAVAAVEALGKLLGVPRVEDDSPDSA